MSKKNSDLDQMTRLASASILMKVVDKIAEAETEAYDTAGSMGDFRKATNLSVLAKAIMSTSGDQRTNQKLIRAIRKLMLQLNRKYPVGELTLKCINDVTMAYQEGLGSHFGRWEQILQNVTLEIMNKTTLLSQNVFIPENLRDVIAEAQENVKKRKK